MTANQKKTEIVTRGVTAQALVDKHLAQAFKFASEYAGVIEDAVKAGFFSSGLEAKAMLAEARSLPGQVAECALAAAMLHQSGTQLAIDNEVDLGSVTTVGGVPFTKRDDGGFTTQGGGGR